MADGTNIAQVAALDLNAELFLAGDTFEHDGLAGSKWTLRPTDTKSYVKALNAIVRATPGGRMFARQAMRTGLVSRALETADDGIERIAGLLLGKNGDRSNLPGVADSILAQWQTQRDAAQAEADKALEGVDPVELVKGQEEALAEAVARHLVVKVENFPVNSHVCAEGHRWRTASATCPECGAESAGVEAERVEGGSNFALAIFRTPSSGETILEDVLSACDAHAKAAAKALEETAGNS